jgi:putative toxin-antitoxin system antitoxin component (TIGR02293 family)
MKKHAKIKYYPSKRKADSVKTNDDNMQDLVSEQFITELKDVLKNTEPAQSWLPQFTGFTLTDFLSNKLLIVFTIRKGISYSLFDQILNYSPFTFNDWAEYLNLSTKSLTRYRQYKKSFKPIHTEKIIEIAEVTYLGLGVFKTNNKFRLWLDTPNYALGNLKPLELLKDSYGKEMVIGELTRIEHGILA